MDRRAAGAARAVLLDLDNTLVGTAHAGRAAIRKVNKLLKATLDLDDEAAGSVCDKFQEKLLLETPDPAAAIDDVRARHWEESIREVVACEKPALAAECYRLWKRSRLDLIGFTPEIRALLEELRGGYKLLLLTNGESQTQREKVAAARCEELFDAIVVGGEHAEQKPHPSIYTHCFSLLGVEAEDCVMVGDSLDTDIQGGFNAGVRATVWINNFGVSQTGSVKPDYTIPTVLDLPAILKGLD